MFEVIVKFNKNWAVMPFLTKYIRPYPYGLPDSKPLVLGIRLMKKDVKVIECQMDTLDKRYKHYIHLCFI